MKLSIIHAGYFKLDGGAMFGVVPKKLWNKLNPADDNNLCTWSMKCLLIEDGKDKILIDTGMGNKQDEKFRSHFEPHGPYELMTSLAENGVKADEITDVFLTHFHFDHVGGALKKEGQEVIPQFPNATYWSNDDHYKWAYDPNFREKASFLKENFVGLKENGVLNMVDVEQGISWRKDIELFFCYGHTEAMMVPIITLGSGKKFAFAADLMPSSYHIRMPYVMSYDIRPLETLKEKKVFLDRAIDEEINIIFEHDPAYECGKVARDDKGRYYFSELFSLKEAL